MSGDTGARPLDGADSGHGRGQAPRRRRGIRVPLLICAALLAACGTAFALGGPDDGPAVAVHDTGPAPTRADLVRQWRTLLARHGRQLTGTSAMSADEIREGLTEARARYAEPDDAMARDACASPPRALFDPHCR